jgi:hypothetical protein
LRIKGDDTPIAPGEWRDVDIPSGAVRDNILPLPYKEPSQTLSMLLDKIIEEGRRFAAVSDLKISDMSSQAPVGTTLAILERVLKVMSAVQARIYYAMKQEFKLLAGIIRDYTPEEYSYEPEVGSPRAKKTDYDDVDVIPVSDPNAATMSQKVVQYQAVIQLAQSAPQLYNLPYLHRQMIEVLGIRNADKLVPMPDDQKPRDPVTENMDAMTGKPLKAFMYQDHEAHIQVHMALGQDPKMAQMIGQNPMGQQITSTLQAHIMEHIAFQYRREIEKQLGVALPPLPQDDNEEYDISPEMEVQMSQVSAMAAARLLQKDQAEMQMQQAAQQQQDPLIQMQQMDLQIKQMEAQTKQMKAQMDAQIRQEELRLKEQKNIIDAAAKEDELRLREAEISGRQQLDAARLGADIEQHKAQESNRQQLEGTRLGVEIAKAQEQRIVGRNKE